jgi:hypothetical protein
LKDGIGLRVERSLDRGATAARTDRRQQREVLQVVRAVIGVSRIVGGYSSSAKIHSEITVGKDRVSSHYVSNAGKDLDAWTIAESNRVGCAAGGAADDII